MAYKLVVMDMDGTLLNSNKEISNKNRVVLEKLRNIGVTLAIATGRIYTTAKPYIEELKIHTPIIACNGAIIRSIKNNKTIYANPISMENCEGVIDICENHGVDFYMYSEDTIFAKKIEKLGKYFIEFSKKLKSEDKIKIKTVENWYNTLNEVQHIYKFVMFSSDQSRVERARREIASSLNLELYKSSKDFLDVINKGMNKGSGVKNLADSLGIKREEIIAIGDNENDISMIEFAGLGIAMGNSIDKVKEVANFVTDTNDDDGLANALNKFILDEYEDLEMKEVI